MKANNPFHFCVSAWRFRNHHRNITIVVGCLLLVQTASAASLIHRYPFDTNANDVITNAHGIVMGGAAFDGTGGVVLDGTNDYVQLPSRLISVLSEVTIEAWVTWQRGTTPYWQRVFDFGNSFVGGDGRSYFFLTPATGSAGHAYPDWMRATVSSNGITGEFPLLDLRSPMPTNAETHVAVTYSPGLGVTKLYVNGAAVAVRAAAIPLNKIGDGQNYLGRSQFVVDPYFKGRFNEFRIYRRFLLDSEIEASFLAGPDTPVVSTGTQIGTTLAVGVTGDTATLNALVQPNGLATMIFFEYGTTTNYGMNTAMLDAGSDTNVVAISSPVLNLMAGTIYHFRCVATNVAGTMYGGSSRFMTQPVITSVSLTNGGVEVQFGASAGMRYYLTQSTNLPPVSWTILTNRLMTADGPFGFTDWTATNHPMRFYRLRVREW